jgi:hypothetical protein
MTEVLTTTALVALWTAAWLHWAFQGHLRQFATSRLFPESWRGGRTKKELVFMDEEEFTIFLAAECQAPPFIRGVLGCAVCLSAHVSAVGVLLLLPGDRLLSDHPPLLALPLVWAGGAYVGHRLHSYLSQPAKR